MTRGFLDSGDLKPQRVGVEKYQQVGAMILAKRYLGPVANVTFDKTWLHISTGLDSHVKLNIKALPALQEALRRIAKHLREQKREGRR